MSVNDVSAASTATRESGLGVDEFGVETSYLCEELVGDAFPFRFDHGGGSDPSQQLGSLSWHHLFAQTTGDQSSEHGVESAGGFGLQAGELLVSFRQHAQHRHMILGGDDPEPGLALRSSAPRSPPAPRPVLEPIAGSARMQLNARVRTSRDLSATLLLSQRLATDLIGSTVAALHATTGCAERPSAREETICHG